MVFHGVERCLPPISWSFQVEFPCQVGENPERLGCEQGLLRRKYGNKLDLADS